MAYQQSCLEGQPGCYLPEDPAPYWPEPGLSPGVPLLFFSLLLGIVIWSFREPKKTPPPKSPEEELFEAIGKFEAKRQKAGKQTRFDYTVTDACVEERKSPDKC